MKICQQSDELRVLFATMKPAVINNNSETPTQTHHEPSNVSGSNNQANNGQPNNDQSRRFPQFRVSVTLESSVLFRSKGATNVSPYCFFFHFQSM